MTDIQNVDAVRTTGLELAAQASNARLNGLEPSGSSTWAHSIVTRNDKFPASVGPWPPWVPKWRATLLVMYRPDARWSFTAGARQSGRRYGTLDNSDPNTAICTGVSSFLVDDVRVHYRIDRQWSAAAGIDSLVNRTCWAIHPDTRRTFDAELRSDL